MTLVSILSNLQSLFFQLVDYFLDFLDFLFYVPNLFLNLTEFCLSFAFPFGVFFYICILCLIINFFSHVFTSVFSFATLGLKGD